MTEQENFIKLDKKCDEGLAFLKDLMKQKSFVRITKAVGYSMIRYTGVITSVSEDEPLIIMLEDEGKKKRIPFSPYSDDIEELPLPEEES